jgi:membrane protease YdiL (CAAX protease family)
MSASVLDRLKASFPPPQVDGAKDNVTAIVTALVGFVVCGFLFYANGRMFPLEEYHIVNAACLLWLPLVVILFALKQSPAEFGLNAGNRKLGWTWFAIGYAVMLPAIIVVAHQPAFTKYYILRLTQPMEIANWAPVPYVPYPTWLKLFYYETLMGVYFFGWEFFFRGFLLNGLAKGTKISAWGAVVLQAIPFMIMHWSLSPGAAKPIAETLSAFPGGIALGYLALRTRTFFYGFLIHWLMAGTLDILVLWPSLMTQR